MTAPLSTLHRLALVVIAAQGMLVGVWAQAFPRSFYDDFPGLGRVWVAVDGPYNEHLVRDVGGLNLGLALVAGIALAAANVVAARAAGAAALVYGVPHLLYHLFNLDDLQTVDAAGTVVSLAIAVLAAVVALAPPRRGAHHTPVPPEDPAAT